MRRLIVTLGLTVVIVTRVAGQEEAVEDELAEPWQDNCETMNPGSNVSTPETGPRPYLLSVSSPSITGAQGVYVNLVAVHPYTFQGFMVQARDEHLKEAVGEFDTQYSDVKVINCFGKYRNTATHVNNASKSKVKMRWTSDNEEPRIIVFYVTVAEKVDPLQKYWALQKESTLIITKAA